MARPYSLSSFSSNLSASEMSGAIAVQLAPAFAAPPYEKIGYYSTDKSGALSSDTLKFLGVEGATYTFVVASFQDPIIPMLYDSQGRTLKYDDDQSDSVGVIRGFVAPYTGLYYFSASWYQGSNASELRASFTIGEDDDTIISSLPVTITSTSAERYEGNNGETLESFTITRTDAGIGPLVLAWQVESTDTTKADFVSSKMPVGSLIFNAGELSKTIVVHVQGDTTAEPSEYYALTIQDPLYPEHGLKYAVGQIRDDDTPLQAVVTSPGQSPSFLFDASFYLEQANLIGVVPIADAAKNYFQSGAALGYEPNAWFDATWYHQHWADLRGLPISDADLFAHFNLWGVWEGRAPGPKFENFDGPRYLSENPDVAAYVNGHLPDFLGSQTNGAIAHFIIFGADELRPAFDTTGARIYADLLI